MFAFVNAAIGYNIRQLEWWLITIIGNTIWMLIYFAITKERKYKHDKIKEQ